jgi:hypothetical protein
MCKLYLDKEPSLVKHDVVNADFCRSPGPHTRALRRLWLRLRAPRAPGHATSTALALPWVADCCLHFDRRDSDKSIQVCSRRPASRPPMSDQRTRRARVNMHPACTWSRADSQKPARFVRVLAAQDAASMSPATWWHVGCISRKSSPRRTGDGSGGAVPVLDSPASL